MIRQELLQQADPALLKKQEFKNLRRKLKTMQRLGEYPSQELVDRYLDADRWLTENVPEWNSHLHTKKPTQS